jgi:hypothetical protein
VTKQYAKKREACRAAQWTGNMSEELAELIGQRKVRVVDDNQQLVLGNGWFARVGDWIMSTSGEDITVIGDDVFHKTYDEVDEAGRVLPPTDDEHEAAAQSLIRDIDELLVTGLRLTREDQPNVFRARDLVLRKFRLLLEDHTYTVARRERHRVRDRIVKELTP